MAIVISDVGYFRLDLLWGAYWVLMPEFIDSFESQIATTNPQEAVGHSSGHVSATVQERHAVLHFIEQGLMPKTGKRFELKKLG